MQDTSILDFKNFLLRFYVTKHILLVLLRTIFIGLNFSNEDLWVWIIDAPTVQKNTYKEVAEFVDKYITCNAQSADPQLINYQTHRHARTCMKKNKPICRFNFPIPPMPNTVVLSPLEEDDEHYTQATTDYQKVVEFLNFSSFKKKTGCTVI